MLYSAAFRCVEDPIVWAVGVFVLEVLAWFRIDPLSRLDMDLFISKALSRWALFFWGEGIT